MPVRYEHVEDGGPSPGGTQKMLINEIEESDTPRRSRRLLRSEPYRFKRALDTDSPGKIANKKRVQRRAANDALVKFDPEASAAAKQRRRLLSGCVRHCCRVPALPSLCLWPVARVQPASAHVSYDNEIMQSIDKPPSAASRLPPDTPCLEH